MKSKEALDISMRKSNEIQISIRHMYWEDKIKFKRILYTSLPDAWITKYIYLNIRHVFKKVLDTTYK